MHKWAGRKETRRLSFSHLLCQTTDVSTNESKGYKQTIYRDDCNQDRNRRIMEKGREKEKKNKQINQQNMHETAGFRDRRKLSR